MLILGGRKMFTPPSISDGLAVWAVSFLSPNNGMADSTWIFLMLIIL